MAIQSLRRRGSRFGAELIEQFAKHVGAGSGSAEVRELALRAVTIGMIILRDVRTHLGTLLVPRGFEVTGAVLERIQNFGPELLSESVKVTAPAAHEA